MMASVKLGTASVADLQAPVSTAAGALDYSNAEQAELRDALERLAAELEMIRLTVDEADQTARAVRLVERYDRWRLLQANWRFEA